MTTIEHYKINNERISIIGIENSIHFSCILWADYSTLPENYARKYVKENMNTEKWLKEYLKEDDFFVKKDKMLVVADTGGDTSTAECQKNVLRRSKIEFSIMLYCKEKITKSFFRKNREKFIGLINYIFEESPIIKLHKNYKFEK